MEQTDTNRDPLGKQHRLSAIRYPSFRLYMIGLAFTYIGFWTQVVAQGWLVLRLTDSPLLLGLVMSTNTMPFLIFGLLGGVVADRFNKQKIIVISRICTMILVSILVILTATNHVEAWHIFVIALMVSSFHAFDIPATQAFIPELIPKNALVGALSLSSGVFNIGRIIGPAIAGFVIATIGEAGAFTIFIIANLIFITCFAFIRPNLKINKLQRKWTIHKDIFEALIYVKSNKTILPIVLLAATAYMFVTSPMALLPDFTRGILDLDSVGLGKLAMALGIGAGTAGILIAIVGDIPKKGLFVLITCFCMGIALFIFSQTTSFPISFVALASFGLFQGSFSVTNMSLLFLLVPNTFHGRIMSLMVLTWGFTAFGNIAAGSVAENFGTPTALMMAGIYISLCAVIIYITYPSLKKI